MTHGSDGEQRVRSGVKEYVWEHDTVGQSEKEEYYGPDGRETVYYYAIYDTSIEGGWIRSSESRNLAKMR